MNWRTACLTLALAAVTVMPSAAQSPWRAKLKQQMPLLGHRNWIVIADSAYPWQTSPGIETVVTDADQTEVVQAVLDAVGKSIHVRPTIFMDAELPFVPEAEAKGVTAYRAEVKKALGSRPVESLPHEQIIGKLDEAGKAFHVLLLKTKMTLPYTSVFIQLRAGYWNDESEQKLRDAIKAAAPPQASVPSNKRATAVR